MSWLFGFGSVEKENPSRTDQNNSVQDNHKTEKITSESSADTSCYDSGSIITIDLLDFDAVFKCPLCSALGDHKTMNIFTLSDHIGEHKYAAVLAEKQSKQNTDIDEVEDMLVRKIQHDSEIDQLEINVVNSREQIEQLSAENATDD